MTADPQSQETQLELLPAPIPAPDVPDVDSDKKSETKDMHLDSNPTFTLATSFDEFDAEQKAKESAIAVRNDASLMKQMVNNIMFTSDSDEREPKLQSLADGFKARISDTFSSIAKSITKQKEFKTEGGVKFPASDFAFVPDRSKPSTWKLRLATERPGNITVKQLGRAAAAFSPGGFRGNRVQIPSPDVPKVKARIRREYSKLGVKLADVPKSVKEQSLMFWKEGNTTRWFAVYSNNYRDEDNPPEIIAAQSHERFVKMVDSGEYPMPVLQHYHIPGTEWGQADWVSYDKDTGFMMASGYVLPGHEKEAEAIEQMDNIILSHGMPRSSIKRMTDDDSIIIEHQTEEISDLPYDVAANKLTSFEIFNQKDITMPIPQQKKDYLLEAGLDEDKISTIEQSLDAKKESAMAQELESKEETQQEEAQPEAAPETKTDKPEDKPTEEPSPVAAFSDAQTKELAEFTTALRTSLLKEMSDLLTETLVPLTDAIKEQSKSDADRIAQMPPASLSDIILGGNVLKNLSAIQADETIVDKRTKESKDGPVQTEVAEKSIIHSGDPFFDGLIPDIVNNTPIEEIKV